MDNEYMDQQEEIDLKEEIEQEDNEGDLEIKTIQEGLDELLG